MLDGCTEVLHSPFQARLNAALALALVVLLFGDRLVAHVGQPAQEGPARGLEDKEGHDLVHDLVQARQVLLGVCEVVVDGFDLLPVDPRRAEDPQELIGILNENGGLLQALRVDRADA